MDIEFLKTVAILTAAFVPLHQGLIELFKLVTRMKQRRYYQQLAYIVYEGLDRAPDSGAHPERSIPCRSL